MFDGEKMFLPIRQTEFVIESLSYSDQFPDKFPQIEPKTIFDSAFF